MADYSMSESDISALKNTLYTQQNLLQQLYNELEAEREASATAANEALSLILRLQGEKAAIKMEAEQYKRLSEEKICHAEESLAIIEDVIYQKEMEVAALDHQVQAYRYKLLSMGCNDPGSGDSLLERNENLGRRNSAPVFYKSKVVGEERESCGVEEIDLVSRLVGEKTRLPLDSDKKADSSSSYWDQIRKLDVRVKEIVGPTDMDSRSESSSLSARIMSNKNRSNSNDSDHMKRVESGNGVSSCCMSIHDVFEVPKVDENLSSCESIEGEEVDHPEEVKMDGGDEPDWIKKMLKSDRSMKKLCVNSSNIDCNLVAVQPRTSMSSEIVEEVDRSAESSEREEELKLLNEIREKLDLLHDEIRGFKVKKTSTRDEPSLSVLSEAMLYFWL